MDDHKQDHWAYPGEWKEYHSNDISEIKFVWSCLGFGVGATLSGIATAWFLMH